MIVKSPFALQRAFNIQAACVKELGKEYPFLQTETLPSYMPSNRERYTSFDIIFVLCFF